LETCPRCRTLLASYRKFIAPGPQPAGANLVEAEAELTQRMRGALHGPAPAPGLPRAEPGLVPRATAPDFWARLRAALSAPAFRPAWAALAILAVVGTTFVLFELQPGSGSRPVLRGAGPDSVGGSPQAMALLPAKPVQGGIRLAWT